MRGPLACTMCLVSYRPKLGKRQGALDYERFRRIHGVVHITAAGGGAPLETPWRRDDPRTAFRTMHLEHVRVDVTPNALRLEAVCGPATESEDRSCPLGQVIDSVTIQAR